MTSRFSYRIYPSRDGFLVRVFWPACYFRLMFRPEDFRLSTISIVARQIEAIARQNQALEEIRACLLIARDELMERGIIAA